MLLSKSPTVQRILGDFSYSDDDDGDGDEDEDANENENEDETWISRRLRMSTLYVL